MAGRQCLTAAGPGSRLSARGGLPLGSVESFAVPNAIAPPRCRLRFACTLAAFAVATLPWAASGDDPVRPAAPAAPAGSESGSKVFDEPAPDSPDETAPDSPAGEPVTPPPSPPRVRHPQPSLRHATPRYEATYAVPPADAALLRRLEEPLPPGGIRLPENATLLDLEDWLSQQAKVRVRIAWRALEDAGLEAETPLETTRVEGGGLRASLRALLDDIDLATIVEHGTLLVTTAEAAEETLTVGFYPLPTQVDAGNLQTLIDLIQSSVAADTWDTVGGPGAIRAAEDANTLAISQTQEVHAEILTLMRSEFDADLVSEGGPAGQIPTRVHRVRDAALATELAMALVALCNQALGPAGDPTATVTRIGGDRLVVQSASRPFQIYAAEIIRAVNGVEGAAILHPGMGMPEEAVGNPFCWVAREVYGQKSPRWLAFRDWLASEGPHWLRHAYAAHGEALATWLRDRPLAKAALRALMDTVIAGD